MIIYWLTISANYMFITSASLNCDQTHFKCGNKTHLQCIPWLWVCDGDSECIDGSDESSAMCKNIGACGGSFNATKGILSSPLFPENYQDNVTCIYKISQENNTVILLDFLTMNMSLAVNDQDEYSDYLEIRDGPSEASPFLALMSGSKVVAPIQTTQNKLWMK